MPRASLRPINRAGQGLSCTPQIELSHDDSLRRCNYILVLSPLPSYSFLLFSAGTNTDTPYPLPISGMATGIGHLHQIVAKNARLLQHVYKQATNRLAPLLRTGGIRHPLFQQIPVCITNHPIHPIALLKQTQSRWSSSQIGHTKRGFVTAVRKSAAHGVKYNRSSFRQLRLATTIAAHTGRAPFATTLRPNITGGALRRTAGGYGLGSGCYNGARYFSHSPALAHEVVQSVSQAIRALHLAGKRTQFDGYNQGLGTKKKMKWKTVSQTQQGALKQLQSSIPSTPGSWVEFAINPTITAFTPLGLATTLEYTRAPFYDTDNHLNTSGLLDVLSSDFSRALNDLAVVIGDLKRLANLGDLPITYRDANKLCVHFPGCDAETVERICGELDVRRGAVFQDELFDRYAGTEIALLFPSAPNVEECNVSEVQSMHSSTRLENKEQQERYSMQSEHSFYNVSTPPLESARCTNVSNRDGYTSLDEEYPPPEAEASDPLEYRNFEGIYRFIEMCDNARR